ncbi:hypothetical protein [Endozoicomonas atrinae]|uniref:hypothetical protein n=1 Tax=Endozoicomonas atrinae TaxID=1333660 RepID=UPI000B0756CB|nr:hypothetical protein [Endozoicomonas atrinae]
MAWEVDDPEDLTDDAKRDNDKEEDGIWLKPVPSDDSDYKYCHYGSRAKLVLLGDH